MRFGIHGKHRMELPATRQLAVQVPHWEASFLLFSLILQVWDFIKQTNLY